MYSQICCVYVSTGSTKKREITSSWYRETTTNGCVALYADKNFNMRKVDLRYYCSDLDLELTDLDLVDINMIVSVYQSLNGNSENFITNLENCLCQLTCLK